MTAICLEGPFTKEKLGSLRAGDQVLLSGILYTARDAAHRRMTEALKKGERLPFDLRDALIYYVGPTPARPGRVIGSAGPTTSYRMDDYVPELLRRGQSGMIGKGPRSDAVNEAIAHHHAVYFTATGGAGALIGRCIQAAEVIAYEDLGPEAIRRLTVRNMPVIVATDSRGMDLYRRKKDD